MVDGIRRLLVRAIGRLEDSHEPNGVQISVFSLSYKRMSRRRNYFLSCLLPRGSSFVILIKVVLSSFQDESPKWGSLRAGARARIGHKHSFGRQQKQ